MNISSLIQALQNPDSYSHTVQTPIKVIQTHISVIFLTGSYAYKIKKPVDFGFLDYSTLEKRQHFITQELTMNQVIAPDIYLDVLPITLQNNQVEIEDQDKEFNKLYKAVNKFGDQVKRVAEEDKKNLDASGLNFNLSAIFIDSAATFCVCSIV